MGCQLHGGKEMFLDHKISILEWFLKDHVTLSNDAENSALHYRNKLNFTVLNCNNISHYFFYCIFFNQKSAAFKGIVHPKMKILSSFTHPQVVPNLYECLCSAEHKGRYSEECGKQSSSGAPLTSIVFFSYYGSQWCPKTAWLQTFFKISSFVFGRTKNFIQVWNYLRVSKWQNFHFWVNYPFKGIC